jgi:NADH-quinone oxidoreductase subunit G
MFGEGPVSQMSCMVDVMDGMVISTQHPEAVAFRKQIITMADNHLYTPVCDEGGQCLPRTWTIG